MQPRTRELCAESSAHGFDDFLNAVILGDCCFVMQQFPSNSIDLVVTDPPYLINYKSRDGRTIAGDTNDAWLRPAFCEAYRVLKAGGFRVSFMAGAKLTGISRHGERLAFVL